MRKHLTTACLAVLLASLAAAAAAGPARSAGPQPKRLSDCKVAPFAQIAGIIGPLDKKTAVLMPKRMSFGQWWICEAYSRATHTVLSAFCHQPKQVAQMLFNRYAKRTDLQGKGGLTWKPVKGVGDQAVLTHVSHDVQTGGESAGLVVRRHNDIFFIVGNIGMKAMPQAELLRLTRLALRYDCN